jgi:hypothetical protein
VRVTPSGRWRRIQLASRQRRWCARLPFAVGWSRMPMRVRVRRLTKREGRNLCPWRSRGGRVLHRPTASERSVQRSKSRASSPGSTPSRLGSTSSRWTTTSSVASFRRKRHPPRRNRHPRQPPIGLRPPRDGARYGQLPITSRRANDASAAMVAPPPTARSVAAAAGLNGAPGTGATCWNGLTESSQ